MRPEQRYPRQPAATADITSQEAARDLAPRAQRIRDRVENLLRVERVTVHEAAERLGLPVPTVQPRFSELRQMRRIQDSGLRRRNEASGKNAKVWELVPKPPPIPAPAPKPKQITFPFAAVPGRPNPARHHR